MTDSRNTYLTQDELLIENLLNFYKTDETGTQNINLDKMLQIITGKTRISLRIVDWFTTNYAKKYPIVYNLKSNGDRFKVHKEYKNELKSFSKYRFDPFCRWERISIPYKNKDMFAERTQTIPSAEGDCSVNKEFIETTIGQLNFFKWAIEKDILDYIDEHFSDIEKDMNNHNSTAKRREQLSSETGTGNGGGSSNTTTRKKREELSVSATKNIRKENVEIIVKFG